MITPIKIAILYSFLPILAFGQQLPIFNQYRENLGLLNPASMNIENEAYGLDFNSVIGISFRKQWVGTFQDGPLTGIARYDHLIPSYNMLIGGAMVTDQTGLNSLSGPYLRYAYRFNLNEETYLSLGVGSRLLYYRYDGEESVLRDANDQVGLEMRSHGVLDFNLGVFFRLKFLNDDLFFAGASIPQLGAFNVNENEGADYYSYNGVRHYYGFLGYYKFFEGSGRYAPNSFLESSLWLKHLQNVPPQVGLYIRYQSTKVLWVGVGYSTSYGDNLQSDILHSEVGLLLDEKVGIYNGGLKIGYGFDYSFAAFGPRFGPTHELGLTYFFKR